MGTRPVDVEVDGARCRGGWEDTDVRELYDQRRGEVDVFDEAEVVLVSRLTGAQFAAVTAPMTRPAARRGSGEDDAESAANNRLPAQ